MGHKNGDDKSELALVDVNGDEERLLYVVNMIALAYRVFDCYVLRTLFFKVFFLSISFLFCFLFCCLDRYNAFVYIVFYLLVFFFKF